MDSEKIGKFRSLVAVLEQLASAGSIIADSEKLCQFTTPTDRFEPTQTVLESSLAELDLAKYFRADNEVSSYRVNLNKDMLWSSGVMLFISLEGYRKWIGGLQPFYSNGFLNSNDELPKYLFVPGLKSQYAGPKLHILSVPLTDDAARIFDEDAFRALPLNVKIKEQVHILTNDCVIEPRNYVLWNPELNEDIKPIVKYSIMTLAACLSQEIKTLEIVTVRGMKRLELSFSTPSDFDGNLLELQKLLVDVVSWVNEEKRETRSKLIADRLSLDMAADETFVFGITKYLGDALTDAKDKYGFIISEKSDEYHKERRTIQAEVNKQLQSYAEKTRTLLSNFLRDTLAGLFLVGFSLFGPTKLDDIPKILGNPYLKILLNGLAIYFIVSLVVQVAVNITDVVQSKRELIRLTKEIRNYMRAEEVEAFINKALKGRQIAFWIFFGVLILVYIAVIYFLLNFSNFAAAIQSTVSNL